MADLFGPANEPDEVAQLISGRCQSCGAMFDASQPKGRPLRFCSDRCRQISKSDRIRAWRPGEKEPTQCGFCQRPLPHRKVSGGRFRRFCNSTCLKRARRGAITTPDFPDLLSKPEEQP